MVTTTTVYYNCIYPTPQGSMLSDPKFSADVFLTYEMPGVFGVYLNGAVRLGECDAAKGHTQVGLCTGSIHREREREREPPPDM